jgi:ATP-binding protein involved in chromosome partitioning
MSNKKPLHLPDCENVILVSGGKPGVGISTVAAGLAVSLADSGFKTALFDANIFSPDIPAIFDIVYHKPETIDFKGIRLMLPRIIRNVKINSPAFFLDAAEPMVLPANVIIGFIKQLLLNTHWEETDFLILDLPAGTGELQMAILQELQIDKALLVTSPHKMSVAPNLRYASFLGLPGIDIPITGVAENNLWPTENLAESFKASEFVGAEKPASALNVEVTAQIPFVKSLFESGVLPETLHSSYFVLAKMIAGQTKKKNQ